MYQVFQRFLFLNNHLLKLYSHSIECEQGYWILADKGKTASTEDWEDVRNNIHQFYPDFTNQCHVRCHNLNHTEFQVCCLSCIGLRQKQMACLLNTSQQNIHNIRKRLYTRFTDKKCETVKQFTALIKDIKQNSLQTNS